MKWITKGKPKANGTYIVTTQYGSVSTVRYWNGYWNAFEGNIGYAVEDDYITAWMPMPEAYKEGENNG